MKEKAILAVVIVILVGFIFITGCDKGSSAKMTTEPEVIQASAYAENGEAVKACSPGCEKPCCDKDPSNCPKAASGCPKEAAAASGCSK
jgi:hypothetical protein